MTLARIHMKDSHEIMIMKLTFKLKCTIIMWEVYLFPFPKHWSIKKKTASGLHLSLSFFLA